MSYKVDELCFETTLSLLDIEKLLNKSFLELGVENIETISGSNAAIRVVISAKTAVFSPLIWAIQVFVRDLGNRREITLNALGSNIGQLVFSSLKKEKGVSIDFSVSKKKRDKLYNKLR